MMEKMSKRSKREKDWGPWRRGEEPKAGGEG
jgi:hypothetical protein